MEHRESPRRAAAEHATREAGGGDPLSSRRFTRFVTPPGVRRLALSRVAVAALLVAGALGTLAVLGSLTLRTLPEYLHRQPVYQFRFREIVLEPPPPSWYRGGATAFLDRLRAVAREPEQQSALDLDLERLGRIFRLDPWVRKVVRVSRTYPNRVVVSLLYREPVTFVSFGQARPIVLLDGEGVILSEEEIDRDACGPLIQLGRVKLPPVNARPGETWKRASESGGEPQVDELVVCGAALAAYLKSVQDELEHGPADGLVFSVQAQDTNRLWVQYGHRLFLWGEAPGRESTGELTAAAKWEMLREWPHESPAPPGRPLSPYEYYRIRPTGIEFHWRERVGGS